MRTSSVIVAIFVGISVAAGQSRIDARVQGYLHRLFPGAVSFSVEDGPPRHFNAYSAQSTEQRKLLGIAFWTTEVEPLERGYDGPIKMIVGMTPTGTLTNVIVVEHHEPYGYFSVDQPAFAAQFVGKSIRDRFRVGEDVDAVSRASITVASAARAIRNASRRVARQFTPPGSGDK